ncbi:Ger(x)C family spore germination protein [Paenibacillus sp. GCM10027626]|uniref:Ger(x)C family spore germination protein n=1 Tax=Paenibacillus sp. GCM10027626 TaxID=3273411 RepID=UPI00364044B8
MLRKMMVAVILLMLAQLLTGCWSRRELNELAIASAIGIDQEGDQFRVSMQIVNPGEVAAKMGGGGGYQTPVTVYTITAKTLLEAVRKATITAPRKVYLAQLRTIIIGESLAKNGIGKAMDFLVRDREIREENLYVLIAKGSRAEDVLKVLTHLDKIPAAKIANAMKTLDKYWAPTSATKLEDIMYDLISGDKYPAMSGIMAAGKKGKGDSTKNVQTVDSPTILKFDGTGVFYKDRLVGWLNEEESKGYNYITNRVVKTAGHYRCPGGGNVAIDVIRTRTQVTAQMEKGEPSIHISLWLEGNIADFQCKMDLSEQANLRELERLGGERLRAVVQAALDKVQRELKTDVFGFGERFHQKYPKQWKKLKHDWDRRFPEIPVHIQTELRIRNTGTMNNSFYDVTKE